MKKIGKIILTILSIIIIGILSISYIINQNYNSLDQIKETIQQNYPNSGEITYANLYGNYYIFTTETNVIVLNREYKEVLKEKSNVLASNPNEYPLIYKTNKLMYEKTIIQNNNLIYEYYDAKTNKLIKKTTMEQF